MYVKLFLLLVIKVTCYNSLALATDHVRPVTTFNALWIVLSRVPQSATRSKYATIYAIVDN